jgi:hypothetical protein
MSYAYLIKLYSSDFMDRMETANCAFHFINYCKECTHINPYLANFLQLNFTVSAITTHSRYVMHESLQLVKATRCIFPGLASHAV